MAARTINEQLTTTMKMSTQNETTNSVFDSGTGNVSGLVSEMNAGDSNGGVVVIPRFGSIVGAVLELEHREKFALCKEL